MTSPTARLNASARQVRLAANAEALYTHLKAIVEHVEEQLDAVAAQHGLDLSAHPTVLRLLNPARAVLAAIDGAGSAAGPKILDNEPQKH